jgi:hypothetical protein
VAHEQWQDAPDDHDFPAAEAYLSLLAGPDVARAVVDALRTAPTATYLAKDLLRASSLELLERDNEHVAHDLDKVKAGKLLSPVLLVRGDARHSRPLTVADGYHRICASYWIDENSPIPVRITDWPSS